MMIEGDGTSSGVGTSNAARTMSAGVGKKQIDARTKSAVGEMTSTGDRRRGRRLTAWPTTSARTLPSNENRMRKPGSGRRA
jgi:hypothetical protein